MYIFFRENKGTYSLHTKNSMQTTKILPPISIIIITLNEEKRLPRLLEQLSRQTYQDIQLIVSDSNSTDTTRQAAEAYNHVGHNFTFHQCGVTK